MNCCDDYGNCRQGRDCPVRTTRAAPSPAPAPSLIARAVRFIAYGLLGIVMYGSVIYVLAKPAPRVYDCSMASFHPDYPKGVRKECREVKR